MVEPFELLSKNPGMAIMLVCVVIIFRELIAGVKILTKKTEVRDNVSSNEILVKIMNELATNLHLLNDAMKHQAEISRMRHDQVMVEVQSIRAKIEK